MANCIQELLTTYAVCAVEFLLNGIWFLIASISIGFDIKSVGCSYTSIVLACDNSKLIAWGASPTYGELVSLMLFDCYPQFDRFLNFFHSFRASAILQNQAQSQHTLRACMMYM